MKISKNILIGVGAFIVAAAISFSAINGFYKRKIDEIEESYTAQIQEIVEKEKAAIAHADSVDFIVVQYKIQMDSISKIEAKLRWENEQFEQELINAWHIIFDATEDENYEYLQKRYPSDDTLKYPFSGEQVKGIALDIVKLNFKDSMFNNQIQIVTLLREQLMKSNNMIQVLNIERQDLEFLNIQMLSQLAAKTEELGMTKEEVAELKKRLRIRTTGGIGTIAALAALIVLL